MTRVIHHWSIPDLDDQLDVVLSWASMVRDNPHDARLKGRKLNLALSKHFDNLPQADQLSDHDVILDLLNDNEGDASVTDDLSEDEDYTYDDSRLEELILNNNLTYRIGAHRYWNVPKRHFDNLIYAVSCNHQDFEIVEEELIEEALRSVTNNDEIRLLQFLNSDRVVSDWLATFVTQHGLYLCDPRRGIAFYDKRDASSGMTQAINSTRFRHQCPVCQVWQVPHKYALRVSVLSDESGNLNNVRSLAAHLEDAHVLVHCWEDELGGLQSALDEDENIVLESVEGYFDEWNTEPVSFDAADSPEFYDAVTAVLDRSAERDHHMGDIESAEFVWSLVVLFLSGGYSVNERVDPLTSRHQLGGIASFGLERYETEDAVSVRRVELVDRDGTGFQVVVCDDILESGNSRVSNLLFPRIERERSVDVDTLSDVELAVEFSEDVGEIHWLFDTRVMCSSGDDDGVLATLDIYVRMWNWLHDLSYDNDWAEDDIREALVILRHSSVLSGLYATSNSDHLTIEILNRHVLNTPFSFS